VNLFLVVGVPDLYYEDYKNIYLKIEAQMAHTLREVLCLNNATFMLPRSLL
jgi:hypothetical protein